MVVLVDGCVLLVVDCGFSMDWLIGCWLNVCLVAKGWLVLFVVGCCLMVCLITLVVG